MKKFIFTLLILLLCSFECKAEVYKILNFEEESLPIINENFRRLGAKALRVDHLERHTEFESLIDGQMKDHDQDTIVSVETITLLNDGKYAYSDDDTIRFTTAGTEQINITDGYVSPTTNADIDFGISTKRFSDIWLSDTIRLGNDGDDVTLKYDTTDNQLDINQDVNIEKDEPECRLTDTNDSGYVSLRKSDIDSRAARKNLVYGDGVGFAVSNPTRANNYINFGTALDSIIDYDKAFSVSMWFKPYTASSDVTYGLQNLGLFGNSTSTKGFNLVLGRSAVWVSIAQNKGTKELSVYRGDSWTNPPHPWRFVTITYDGSNNASGLKIFTAKVPQTTIGPSGTIWENLPCDATINTGNSYRAFDKGWIGNPDCVPEYYDGIIDEIIVWNRTLTSAEVSAIFNVGVGSKVSPTSSTKLIAYLEDTNNSIMLDSSGNNNHGTIVGTLDGAVGYVKTSGFVESNVWVSQTGDTQDIGKLHLGDSRGKTYLQGSLIDFSITKSSQLKISDGVLYPTLNNDIDLGTAALQYKNIYVDGLAYIDGFGEDTDMGDFDITSIDKLEGFDAGIYIDMGADSIMDIAADGNINIITPLIKINNANIEFEGTVDEFETTLVFTNPTTVDKTITFQNASGIVAMDTTACMDLDGDALTITTGVLNFDGGNAPGGELGGTWASPTVDTVHSGSAHHNPITLNANADTVLSLSTQEVGLDTQVANYVFVGPVSGVAAIPTFRAIVDADIPDNITITEVDPTVDTVAEIMAIIDNEALNFGTGVLTAAGFVGPLTGNVTGNATTVTNATLTTALTVNTGTVTLTGNVANTSALTIGAGAVSVSGSNTGDNAGVTSVTGTSPIASSGGVTPDISIPAATNAAAGHATAAHIAAIEANTAKVTNATHTGDATGATALTVVGINGTLMSGLATGILKNTTTTGVPSIAIAADFPTLNQNTTGNATTATTATHLAGGSGGTIPYQSAAGTTAMLANGTAGQVLQSNGTTLAPSWVAAGGGGLVAADIDTSAELAAIVTDETGTGALCFATAPTFTTSITTPIINLTGGQIAFPATAVPSANANTLDDYEEGTWTSGLQFGKAAVGITYSNRLATYVKIGKLVVVKCWILLSSKGTSTGSATVEGLPFVDVAAFPINVFIYDGVSFVGHVSGFIPSGSTSLNFREITEAGSGTNLDNVDFSNTSDFQIFAAYEI